MARKATRSKARSTSRTKSAATRPAPTGSPRERIVEAFMALLAEQPIERIGLAEIAERAGVTSPSCAANSARHWVLQPPTSEVLTRCWPRSIPTWRRNRRASGCSTC